MTRKAVGCKTLPTLPPRVRTCGATIFRRAIVPDINNVKIAFIGFGNMASAMADGWIRSGKLRPEQLGASSRRFDVLKAKTEARGMRAFEDNRAAALWADVVVIAVKPYLVREVTAPIADVLAGKTVLSVAVNLLFEDYEKILAPGTHHLSTLPNTPVAVNEGIVVCEARHSLSDEESTLAHELFNLLGLAVDVDAKAMPAAGTVSGCGPAFAAMFIEALADGAVRHGVPRAAAYQLASQMLAGTAKLQLATGAHPGVMKDAVCSPGGTTIVGVAALERRGFRSAVMDSIDAIVNR